MALDGLSGHPSEAIFLKLGTGGISDVEKERKGIQTAGYFFRLHFPVSAWDESAVLSVCVSDGQGKRGRIQCQSAEYREKYL
jgi:hypothetical protein